MTELLFGQDILAEGPVRFKENASSTDVVCVFMYICVLLILPTLYLHGLVPAAIGKVPSDWSNRYDRVGICYMLTIPGVPYGYTQHIYTGETKHQQCYKYV